jgi:hypothetical protein
MDWEPGSRLYGDRSIYHGTELVHLKVLSDRRAAGGGLAYLVKFSPPPKKLIKVVAVTRSNEHVFILEGGFCNKAGKPLRGPGDYALNPSGHPHSAFIGSEVVSLAVYSGEPDDIVAFDVIDARPAVPTP